MDEMTEKKRSLRGDFCNGRRGLADQLEGGYLEGEKG